MQFAPIGEFAAMGAAISTQGIGVLGRHVFTLMQMMRSVMLLVFSTGSSEVAYPKTIEQPEKFGASNRITSFVLP